MAFLYPLAEKKIKIYIICRISTWTTGVVFYTSQAIAHIWSMAMPIVVFYFRYFLVVHSVSGSFIFWVNIEMVQIK